MAWATSDEKYNVETLFHMALDPQVAPRLLHNWAFHEAVGDHCSPRVSEQRSGLDRVHESHSEPRGRQKQRSVGCPNNPQRKHAASDLKVNLSNGFVRYAKLAFKNNNKHFEIAKEI